LLARLVPEWKSIVDPRSQTLEEGSTMDESISSNDQGEAAAWADAHPVNIRVSLPFFGKRFYLTLVAGQERRAVERLKAERAKNPLATRANIIFLGACGVVAGLAVVSIFQMFSVSLLQEIGIVIGGQ
jgi:hypothetical protein